MMSTPSEIIQQNYSAIIFSVVGCPPWLVSQDTQLEVGPYGGTVGCCIGSKYRRQKTLHLTVIIQMQCRNTFKNHAI